MSILGAMAYEAIDATVDIGRSVGVVGLPVKVAGASEAWHGLYPANVKAQMMLGIVYRLSQDFG